LIGALSWPTGPGAPAGIFVLANHSRELDESERIAGRFAQDPGAGRERELRSRRVEQRAGRRVVEAGESVLRQPGLNEYRGVAIANGGQHDDGVRRDSPGNEGERVQRWTVEPLRVIDDQQQRGIGRDLGQEVESGHGNSIVLRGDLPRQAESGIKRFVLHTRQFGCAPPHRPEQLMQPGKRELRFGLHAGLR
jgi:hypothetical protein